MNENQSFLPEDYLSKRIARRTNFICGALFIIVMIGLVGTWFVKVRQQAEVSDQQARVADRIDEAATRLDQLEQLQSQKAEMIRKAKVTSVLVERVPRSLILAELINHMPATLSLSQLELQTQKVKQTVRPATSMQRRQQQDQRQQSNEPEVHPSRIDLSLTGVAPTDVEVSTFMSKLNTHSMFNDVGLEFSEQITIDEKQMRKFRMSLSVRMELDVGQIEPTKVARDLKQDPMGQTIQINETGDLVTPTAEVPTPTD